jgi:hypothetical protein
MSLTSNLRQKTPIGELLMAAVISPSFEVDKRVIEHKAKRWALIGTAFDYRVRMGIAIMKGLDFTPNIADSAFMMSIACPTEDELEDENKELRQDFAYFRILISELNNYTGEFSGSHWEVLEEDFGDTLYLARDKHYFDVRKLSRQLIESGKDCIDLSEAALKFANWDPYYRAGYYNPDWDKVEQDDAEELEALYKVWQENFILNEGDIQMNPNFGESSRLVGGADADLIVGTTLIDWKVINKPRTGLRENMAQLLGYAALAHLEGQTIEHVALYFGRHGQTVTVKIEDLTDIPLATIAASIKKLSLEE